MKTGKRFLSLLLAVLTGLSLLPAAWASGEPAEAPASDGEEARIPEDGWSGTVGEGISWRIEGGVLTISGEGRMPAAATTWYIFEEHPENAPWKQYKDFFSAVIVEAGVTRIGTYSFRDCENIQSVSLPAGLTSIGEFAFSGCTALTDINLPEGLTAIETGAFADSGVSLLVTRLPDSLTSIGQDAFYCAGGAAAHDAGGESVCVQVPVSLTLPAGLKTIGREAFYRAFGDAIVYDSETGSCTCYTLTDVTVPESVESIGYLAFAGNAVPALTILSRNCEIAAEPPVGSGTPAPDDSTLGVPGITTVYGYPGSTAQAAAGDDFAFAALAPSAENAFRAVSILQLIVSGNKLYTPADAAALLAN